MVRLSKKNATHRVSDPTKTESRRSISTEIADQLREQILSAEIGPDEPIKQDHIARRFGVSQAPVREALRQLASERIVVSRLNCGVRVASLDRCEIEETSELRLKLEPSLIENAAGNFTGEDLDLASEAIEAISKAKHVAALMRANARFHEVIYRPANQPVTEDVVRHLRSRYARYLGFMWHNSSHADTSLSEHREILDLLRDGKGQSAGVLLRKHISASTDAILSCLNDKALCRDKRNQKSRPLAVGRL